MLRSGPLLLLLASSAAWAAEAEQKKVLLEVYTGAWCMFCPDGIVFADSLQELWGDRLVVVQVHQGDGMAFSPSPIEEMGNILYPMGSTDRSHPRSRGLWEADVAERMAEAPGASLRVLQHYEDGTRNLEVEAFATFAQAATGATQLRLHVVEHGVSGSGTGWDQVNYYNVDTGFHPFAGMGDPILGFEHPRVLRATPVGVADDGAIAAGAAAGQVESERWELTVPAGWDPATMSVVAFLIDKDVPVGIRRVWQVEELEVGAEAAYDLLGVTGDLDAAEVDFGALPEGQHDDATVTVMSTGTRPLVFGEMVGPTNPAFSVVSQDCAEASHGPETDCTITVRFTPQALGEVSDEVTIPYEAVGGGALTVHLAGEGAYGGAWTMEGAGLDPEVDFGERRIGNAGVGTVTLTSNGTGPLRLGAREEVVAPFSVVSDTCSDASHAAAATCTVGVRFLPAVGGAVSGTLRIPYAVESAGAVEIALKGYGNSAPQAVDDAYTVLAGETLEVDAPGVLGNDVDVDADSFIAFIDESTEGLGMAITGEFVLETTLADAGNTISFTYTAEDQFGQGLPATVRVEVVAPDDGDDTGGEPRSCGCATANPAAAWALITLAALIARRRRSPH